MSYERLGRTEARTRRRPVVSDAHVHDPRPAIDSVGRGSRAADRHAARLPSAAEHPPRFRRTLLTPALGAGLSNPPSRTITRARVGNTDNVAPHEAARAAPCDRSRCRRAEPTNTEHCCSAIRCLSIPLTDRIADNSVASEPIICRFPRGRSVRRQRSQIRQEGQLSACSQRPAASHLALMSALTISTIGGSLCAVDRTRARMEG